MQLQLSTDGIVTNMLLTIVWPCSVFRNFMMIFIIIILEE